MSLLMPRMHRLNGRNGVSHPAPATHNLRYIPVKRWEAAPTWKSSDATSIALSTLITAAVLLPFVVLSPACRHWFVVPVLLCGVIIGMDFVDWMRGRMNLLDPVGILGILGFHCFFLTPLLHVSMNEWMAWVRPPPDWREWLGKMGFVNVAGLLVYAVVVRFGGTRPRPQMPLWQIRHSGLVLLAALIVTAGLQAYVYAHFGGISGYIDLFEREQHTGKSSFTGWGWLFSISEAFPRLALMALTILLWRRKKLSWAVLLLIFVVYFGLLILFGGLRGLRSNIVWSMFWGVGIIHFCLRPLSRKMIVIGLAGMLVFMITYAAYKHGGTKDLKKAIDGQKTEWSSLTKVALWDLSRADVQAYLLYRMSRVGTDYQPSHGRTYVGSVSLLIPEAVWPDRPPTKIQEGTQILFGQDWVLIGKASNLYGLGGEAMLNFGPAAVPLAFGIFALCIRAVRQFVYRLRRHDGRIFMLPVFLSLCILGLVCDSDNVLFFLFQYGAAVVLVLLFTCRPVRTPHRFAGLS